MCCNSNHPKSIFWDSWWFSEDFTLLKGFSSNRKTFLSWEMWKKTFIRMKNFTLVKERCHEGTFSPNVYFDRPWNFLIRSLNFAHARKDLRLSRFPSTSELSWCWFADRSLQETKNQKIFSWYIINSSFINFWYVQHH